MAYISGLGFEERRVGANRHGLRGGAYFECNVDACGLQLLDRDPRPDVLFESGNVRAYFIRAGGKSAENVIARGAGRGRRDDAGCRVLSFDRSVRNHGSRRVRNQTSDRAAGLPKRGIGEGQRKKELSLALRISWDTPLVEIQTSSALPNCQQWHQRLYLWATLQPRTSLPLSIVKGAGNAITAACQGQGSDRVRQVSGPTGSVVRQGQWSEQAQWESGQWESVFATGL